MWRPCPYSYLLWRSTVKIPYRFLCNEILVFACYSCRSFFRRTFQKAKQNLLKPCKRNNSCGMRVSCMSCRYKKCLEVGMDTKLIMGDRSKRSLSKYYPKPKNVSDEQRPSTSQSSRAADTSSVSSQNSTELSPWNPAQNDQVSLPSQAVRPLNYKYFTTDTEGNVEETSKTNEASTEVYDLVPSHTSQVCISIFCVFHSQLLNHLEVTRRNV